MSHRSGKCRVDPVLEAEVDHGSGVAVVSYLPGADDVEAMRCAATSAAAGTGRTHEAVLIPPARAARDAQVMAFPIGG